MITMDRFNRTTMIVVLLIACVCTIALFNGSSKVVLGATQGEPCSDCCEPGYYGSECESFDCFDHSSIDVSSVCSQQGNCTAPDHCECNEGYTGENCELVTCYDVLSNMSDSVCSGNGECVAYDVCDCKEGYSGNNCEFSHCFNRSHDSILACSGHGSCIALDDCHCDAAYFGEQCQYKKPVAILDRSDIIFRCAKSVTVDASHSIYDSRSVVFSWSAQIPYDKTGEEELNEYLKTHNQTTVTIPKSYVPSEGGDIILTLTLYDQRLHNYSSAATTHISRHWDIMSDVLAIIDGAKQIVIRRSSPLSLSGLASFAPCMSEKPPLEYQWSQVSGPVIDVSQYRSGSKLAFGRRVLPGGEYVFQFAVSSPEGSDMTSTTTVQVTVLLEPLSVLIIGGDCQISPNVSHTLNATTTDPELLNESYTHVWSCHSSDNRLCNSALNSVLGAASNKSSLTIPAHTLSQLSSYSICVTVKSVTRSAKYCSSLKTVSLKKRVMKIRYIEWPKSVVSIDQDVKFSAEPEPKDAVCEWSVSPQTEDRGFTHKLGYFGYWIIHLYQDKLTPGNVYTVRIYCTSVSDDSEGYADKSFYFNPPPNSGTMHIEPATGTALSTEFTLSANAWDDVDLPLSYQWAITESSSNQTFMSSATQRSSMVTRLPQGNFVVKLVVSDFYGAVRSMSQSLVVAPMSDNDEQVALEKMEEMLASLSIDLSGGIPSVKNRLFLADLIVSQITSLVNRTRRTLIRRRSRLQANRASRANHDRTFGSIVNQLVNEIHTAFGYVDVEMPLEYSFIDQIVRSISNVLSTNQLSAESEQQVFHILSDLIQQTSIDVNSELNLYAVARPLFDTLDLLISKNASRTTECSTLIQLVLPKVYAGVPFKHEINFASDYFPVYMGFMFAKDLSQRQVALTYGTSTISLQLSANAEELLLENTEDAEVYLNARVFRVSQLESNGLPGIPSTLTKFPLSPVFEVDVYDRLSVGRYSVFNDAPFFTFTVPTTRTPILKSGFTVFCKYLNESAGDWVNDGCSVTSITATAVTCTCAHMSTFVVTNEKVGKGSSNTVAVAVGLGVGLGVGVPVLTLLTFLCLCCCTCWIILLGVCGVRRTKRRRTSKGEEEKEAAAVELSHVVIEPTVTTTMTDGGVGVGGDDGGDDEVMIDEEAIIMPDTPRQEFRDETIESSTVVRIEENGNDNNANEDEDEALDEDQPEQRFILE